MSALFAGADGGDSWVKRRREFTEIRALAWTPNEARPGGNGGAS